MRHIAFVNENTLGHSSYLLPFVRTLEQMPELGIIPYVINASPLPRELRRLGETSVRLLRRWGLDFGATRWRLAASRHVLRQLVRLHAQQPLDAVVVNTQSVGLVLSTWPRCPPVYVCLDATFAQLSDSPWFAPGIIGRFFAPATLCLLRKWEKRLFAFARGFFPWSELAASSLSTAYAIGRERICLLPPSVVPQPERPLFSPRSTGRRTILFLGGDFRRKGGLLLLEAYRHGLRDEFDLRIVTQSVVSDEPGVIVHRGVAPFSSEWTRCWQEADVFVFPSSLETFGIVLLEAMSFGVPVVSSRAGAAAEILEEGCAGRLLPSVTSGAIATAVRQTFENPAHTAAQIQRGWNRVQECYLLTTNTRRLAAWLCAET